MSKAETNKGDMPKGFTCRKCGKVHEFGVYIYAHWGERFVHTCDCGCSSNVQRGQVWPIRKEKVVKK
jgi:lysyl-tRNA synthetase class I